MASGVRPSGQQQHQPSGLPAAHPPLPHCRPRLRCRCCSSDPADHVAACSAFFMPLLHMCSGRLLLHGWRLPSLGCLFTSGLPLPGLAETTASMLHYARLPALNTIAAVQWEQKHAEILGRCRIVQVAPAPALCREMRRWPQMTWDLVSWRDQPFRTLFTGSHDSGWLVGGRNPTQAAQGWRATTGTSATLSR